MKKFNLVCGSHVSLGRTGATILECPAGDVRRDYAKLRALGISASNAMRTARILARWRELEDTGKVRLLSIPDDDPSCALEWLEQSADDMAEGNEREWKATGKRERERVERDGVFGLVSQFRTSENEPWEQADSVFGLVSDDGLCLGDYAPDCMRAAMDELEKALSECCATCGRAKVTREVQS